jgi:sigma-B regulation protein RsbU (phosphoserine phosphatase)
MQQIGCSRVWGGIEAFDSDVCTATVTASIYSSAYDGGKGGDIYYLSVCGADMLTRIAVADVVGHGRAVADMSQWLLDTLVARMNSAETTCVLGDLNALTVERGFQALTTAAIASFYRGDWSLTFCNAGHPPILLRPRANGRWERVTLPDGRPAANLPLAVDKDTAYAQRTIPMQSGDRVLLYTDGLIEAPGRDGAPFGLKRLERVLTASGGQSLDAMKATVLDAVREHTGGPLAHDDVTLLAIEVN